MNRRQFTLASTFASLGALFGQTVVAKESVKKATRVFANEINKGEIVLVTESDIHVVYPTYSTTHEAFELVKEFVEKSDFYLSLNNWFLNRYWETGESKYYRMILKDLYPNVKGNDLSNALYIFEHKMKEV